MPAIEGDQELKGIEDLLQNGKGSSLLRIVSHEELVDDKPVSLKEPQSHHKGKCAGAT